jgi:hypothetical protein
LDDFIVNEGEEELEGDVGSGDHAVSCLSQPIVLRKKRKTVNETAKSERNPEEDLRRMQKWDPRSFLAIILIPLVISR